MKITNSIKGYGIAAILLHWIMAVLIIGLFALGKYMVDLDYYDQWYHSAPWWHKSFGVTVFSLLIFRLIWKVLNETPEPLPTYKNWETKIAKLVHKLFYVLLFILCISGYFISTSKGAAIEVFGFIEIAYLVKYGKMQAEVAGKIHVISTYALFISFVLHVSAAIKHHLLNKDVTLIRMLKPLKK